MGEERVKNRYASGKGMENNMQENKLLLDFFSILLHNSKSIRGQMVDRMLSRRLVCFWSSILEGV